MDLFGEFHKVEIHGKPCLVYHNVMKPLPQILSPNSSDEETTIRSSEGAIESGADDPPTPPLPQIHTPRPSKITIDFGDDFPPQPLFLCPRFQTRILLDSLDQNMEPESQIFSKFETSPLFDDTSNGHHVFPLFWCNNKEVDPEGEECYGCSIKTIGTDYYLCVECDRRYHKECVESPLEICHPSHVKHSLQLYYSMYRSDHCIYCTKRATYRIYYCALCDISMHPICAQAAIPFFIDQPKRHDHTLSLFPRQASLTCNVCALVNKLHLTYVCRSICDFVAHSDCIQIPQSIRISRHQHRVSFTSSLPLGNSSCGVCRQEVDRDYGGYTCNVCSGYVVHTRCALRLDIWDGIELEGVPDEDGDIEPPFEIISDGIIIHFSHGCHMKFDDSGVYDGNKFCQACALPINEENLYACAECDFILHERCAEAPRKIYHPLHPHPLEQIVVHDDGFTCGACNRLSNSFAYECVNQDCYYILDVVCALVSEPFNYQGHQHPLFLALDPKETPICHICKSTNVEKVFNCIEFQCDFIICFKCATVPYLVRYRHDEHYLTFCRGYEASGSDWCELCEGKLTIGGKEGFYKCNDCCTTLRINCLIGPDPYIKSGVVLQKEFGEVFYQRNNSATRPICTICKSRLPYPVYFELITNGVSYFRCAATH